MERARRVILLPDDNSEHLEREEKFHLPSIEPSNSVPPVDNSSMQTPGDNLSRLDSEMFEVMHSNKFMDMSEKCKNYLQILRRYLFFAQNDVVAATSKTISDNSENSLESTTDKPLPESEILESIPQSHKRKAQLLLRHWRKDDRLKWTNTGKVQIDDKVISDSNISDLLNLVVKKKALNPVEVSFLPGYNELKKFIHDSETPSELINNQNLTYVKKEPSINLKSETDISVTPNKRKQTSWVIKNTPPMTRQQAKLKWSTMKINV